MFFVDSQSSYTQPAAVYGQSQPQRQVMSIKPVQTVNASSSSYSGYSAGTTGQQNAASTSIQSYAPSPSTYASSSYNSSPASYSGKTLMQACHFAELSLIGGRSHLTASHGYILFFPIQGQTIPAMTPLLTQQPALHITRPLSSPSCSSHRHCSSHSNSPLLSRSSQSPWGALRGVGQTTPTQAAVTTRSHPFPASH